MKIDFKIDDIGECQDVQRLHSLLVELARRETDETNYELITRLIRQIEDRLQQISFESQPLEGGIAKSTISHTFTSRALDFWRSLLGPSRGEMELSRQRKELIERASHAETSAFEALVETAEVGKQRDQALERVKQLEQELARLQERE